MDNLECQKLLVAAFIYQSSANVQTHQHSVSTVEYGATPREGHSQTTLITIGGTSISEPANVTHTECWLLQEDGWTVIEQCRMPVSVFSFSACVMEEGIVVTGGCDDKPVTQCWLLSTSTYQWSPLPDLNTARFRHASVCGGKQVYVIAGAGCDRKETSSVECLEIPCRKWETLPDVPKALLSPMAVSHEQGIYVFGGAYLQSNSSQSVFVYSMNMGSWQTLADMPQICIFGSAAVWKDNIYIVGGGHQSCMCYDPAQAQWSTLSQCRYVHVAGPAVVWKERILVCGGLGNEANSDDGNRGGGTSVIEEYDPESDTWTVSEIELPQKLFTHFVGIVETCILT